MQLNIFRLFASQKRYLWWLSHWQTKVPVSVNYYETGGKRACDTVSTSKSFRVVRFYVDRCNFTEQSLRSATAVDKKEEEEEEDIPDLHDALSICVFFLFFWTIIRNFLRITECGDQGAKWTVQTMKHNKQQDSSSCGMLVLMVNIFVLML